MSRFDSRDDYYDWLEGRRSGLERSCSNCGDPVLVDRDELYSVHVFCEHCIRASQDRIDAQRETTKGAA